MTGSAYVQSKEGFFLQKNPFFFAGSFQYLFPRSALQHTALNFDTYCFAVQRNLTGATLMIAQSLPTSTSSFPSISASLPAPGEKRSAAAQSGGETTTRTTMLQQPELRTHPGRSTGLQRGQPDPVPYSHLKLTCPQFSASGCQAAEGSYPACLRGRGCPGPIA